MIELKLTPLSWAAERFLVGNVKKHDIGSIYQSIQRYGFRDPLGHDSNLNGGKGGIIEGNGRLECLVAMYQEDPENPPKGVVLQDGEWLVPIIYGCDASSESEAIAYSLDHNLTMLKGGDRSPYDILSKDFDPEVFDLLKGQFEDGVPTSAFDGDDLDEALAVLDQVDNQMLEFDDFEEDDDPDEIQSDPNKYPLALALDKEDWEDWNSFKESVGLQNDLRAFQRLLATADGR